MRSRFLFLGILALGLSLSSIAGTDPKITDVETVEAISHRAAMSATLNDFAARVSMTAADREEALAALETMAIGKSRMVDIAAENNVFVIESAGNELRAEYRSTPRPQAKIWNRVILLDRPLKEVINDLAAAAKENIYGKKSALQNLFEPKANADGLSTAVPALGIGLRAAARSGLGAPLKEVQNDVCENHFKFSCVAKEDDGKDNKIKITLAGDGFFKRYQVEGFKKKIAGDVAVSTDTYTLRSYSDNEWDPYGVAYAVKKGAAKSKNDATAVLQSIGVAALIRGCASDKKFHEKVAALGCPNQPAGASAPSQGGAITK